MAKAYSIVVFGATGFTGKLVVKHLLKHASSDIKFAIAGRSAAKLDAVKASLTAEFPKAASLPVIIADCNDEKALQAMARQTNVVLTTVGPYALYGKTLVRVCAELGVDYCDLTGEVNFIADTIAKLDTVARSTGARIVTCCGFDSVPTDIGALVAVNALATKVPSVATTGAVVRSYVTSIVGGVSGGTIASLGNVLADKTAYQIVRNPYSLCSRSGADTSDHVAFVQWAPLLKRWTSPFLMASINAKVVRRSNELRGLQYGPVDRFSYSENLATSSTMIGGLVSNVLAVCGLGLLAAALTVPPLRRFLLRMAPQQGEGPSEHQLEHGHCNIRVFASTPDKSDTHTSDVLFACTRDPGYADTAVMISEAAIGLALSKGKPAENGCVASGVLTPASALGVGLQERLAPHHITWKVQSVV